MAAIFNVLILDYGHGGVIAGEYQTTGKRYTFTDSDGFTIYEGVSNRRTAALINTLAQQAGIPVYDCVAGGVIAPSEVSWLDLEQRDTPLSARTQYANALAASGLRPLYLALHSNAVGSTLTGPSQSARGVDVYTSRGQPAADHVAPSIHEAMSAVLPAAGLPVRRGDWSDGDADNEAGFWVLRKTVMPAVLVEAGFFVNLKDARFLDSDRGQVLLAETIFEGIRPWFKQTTDRRTS